MNPAFQKRNYRTALPTLLLGAWLALHARAEEPPAAVPFDTAWRVLLCEVRLGQESRVFLLDTGATDTLLDSNEFHGSPLLGEPISTRAVTDGFRRISNVPVYKPTPLSIGGMSLEPSAIGLVDLSFLNKGIGTPVSGVLGLDAFRNLVVEFDFAAEKIFLHQTNTTLGKFHQDCYIRRQSIQGMYVLDKVIEGERVSLELDTGSTSALHLQKEVFERLLAKGAIKATHPTYLTSATGMTRLEAGIFTRGELCGVSLQGIYTESHEQSSSVGLGLLRRLHLALDIPNSRLYYSPLPHFAKVVDFKSMLGAGFSFENGHAVIAGLATEGVIPQLRVKVRDVITQFGENAGPITLRSVYRTCEAMAGKELPIQIEREGRVIYSGTVRLGEKQYE